MLTAYVTRNRRDLLSILKIRDAEFAEAVLDLPAPDQIKLIESHPTIKVCMYYHLLGELGFGSSAVLQNRLTRDMFVLDFANISIDGDGDPIHIAVFGKQQHQASADLTPQLIGRIEDFVSTETGQAIMADDLKHLLESNLLG